ncbi:MAG: family 43 glycosylhydrolase [Puniceicoccaceae bacterium]
MRFFTLLRVALSLLLGTSILPAQTATVQFDSQRQEIHGFGAVNMPSWIENLSPEELERAFGTGEGQLGFSILRIKVPTDPNTWIHEVPAARQAKEMGALLLATPWSPPPHMKSNGSIVGGELLPEYYADFAQHLADFQTFMTAQGAPLDAISIQNEPDYRVDYESCDWSPQQMIAFLKAHGADIPAKVVISESFQFRRDETDPILRDAEAAAQVDIIGGHIYGGGLFAYPMAQRMGKAVWMTEHLDLETDWESVLATGKEMHDCMLSDFNAYIWWYLRRYYGPLDEDGSISKRGYVMSHFSRFIRPGYFRVQADASPVAGVSVSAYRDLHTGVLVLINQHSEARELVLACEGAELEQMQRFETTQSHNVALLEAVEVVDQQLHLTLPAGSITTLVGALQNHPVFQNPVLPGDHPDLTLFQYGDDFYAGFSNFHRAPFGTILHSKDLMHWRTLTHVIPADWQGLRGAAPTEGTWAGVITHFYDSFWFYFSNTAGGGQYFSKADAPEGPWSEPVQMQGTAQTGPTGYDNSIFVDDDGTPYLLIKPGQFANRIQRIGPDGHLTGELLNLDWVNEGERYSWAEGPVMVKRDGWYYYFVAGNVTGGQWVLRSQSLTDDPASWQHLGEFFEPITDPATGFRGPNHITAPVQLADGTWWTLSHSYERIGNDDWNAMGRQGLLHEVTWDENGKPTGSAPVSGWTPGPRLMAGGIGKKTMRSDSFDDGWMIPDWYVLHPSAAERHSLDPQQGTLRLDASTDRAHLLQRESEKTYEIVTQVRLSQQDTAVGVEGGIWLTNGDASLTLELYAMAGRVGVRYFGMQHEIDFVAQQWVWLKLKRSGHQLDAYVSSDGEDWNPLLLGIDARSLDAAQPNFNSWIGNSVGLYANGGAVEFSEFLVNETPQEATLWLEPECGMVGTLWQSQHDDSASGSAYVEVPNGNSFTAQAPSDEAAHLVFNLQVEHAGIYSLWARVICPTADDDSFWVRVNHGDWILWNGIAPQSAQWTWDQLPQSFSLHEGRNTLTLAVREDGILLDKLCLSQSDQTPEGLGGEASNCEGQ